MINFSYWYSLSSLILSIFIIFSFFASRLHVFSWNLSFAMCDMKINVLIFFMYVMCFSWAPLAFASKYYNWLKIYAIMVLI